MAKAVKAPVPPPEPPPESEVLRTWRTLDVQIMSCTEEQCWQLLEEEKRGKARHLFLQRIYGRAATLRGKREAKELREAAHDLEA